MISICIPIYEFDVTDLVNDLHEQGLAAQIKFEIRCYDDGSSEEIKALNRPISDLEHVVYEELEENIGRSAIRNKLADESELPELLFMDCDSETTDKEFIRRYVQEHDPDTVTYGGRCYTPDPPEDRKKYFHWLYGSTREVTPVNRRQKHPYHSFMTNNFMISRHLFRAIRLDEKLVGYGHEDTLFGKALSKTHIRIKHIDNPLCHIGLEDPEVFLEKTRQGLRNLHTLIKRNEAPEDIKLYVYYKKAKTYLIARYLRKKFRKEEEALVQRLCGNEPSLKDFDFYKLGYLLCLDNKPA